MVVDLFESLLSNSSDETDDIIISENTEDNSEKKLLGKSLLDIAKVIVEEDDVAMFENIQQFCIETYGARSNYFDALIKCHFSRESWESEVGKKILINEKE